VLDRSASTHVHRNGIARKSRQNAVDTGPVSLTLTKRGALAMAIAPARSANTAGACARALGSWDGDKIVMPATLAQQHRAARYLPWNFGLRFSMNAAMPSF
jgi:hypothetical protein